jgi:parallel beta-helix repeat protein
MMIPGKLKWYAILALALWLAFSGVAAAEQLYVNESGWWWVDGAFNASGTPISAAVGAAAVGDSIYVYGGNYSENVDVDKPRITLEGAGADVVTVTAAVSGDHVFNVTGAWVNISGFTVRGATGPQKAGIYLGIADHCNLTNNAVSNNGDGIYISYSSSSTLTNNTISNKGCGIRLYYSSNNTFTNNTFVDDGLHLRDSYENIVENNTVNGKPLVYLENVSNFIIQSAGQAVLVKCTNITVENLNIFNTFLGIELWETNDCEIVNNTVSNNNWGGIRLYYSSSNTLANNSVSNNSGGIYLSHSSSNTLTNNTVSNNGDGIWLDYSSNNNIITNNTALDNSHGILLQDSGNNTLIENTISGKLYNFDITGSSLSHFLQNIDTSNKVDGKPIYYLVNEKDRLIPSDAGFVGLVNSTNMSMKDLILTNNGKGILFVYTCDSRIENVSVSNNSDGIDLYTSSNNTPFNNIASNNNRGIVLVSSSHNNTIANNTASNSNRGIVLYSSSNNTLSNNNASLNNYYGIYMWHSSNNVLAKNTANSNNYGIWLSASSNNTVTCNWVQSNRRGFHFRSGSANNRLSYNNAIENGNYNTTTGGREWQFYNDQPEAVDAKHNYWGAGMNNNTIDASIYDDESSYLGKVEFYPFETEPVPCATVPEEPPAFTTPDAVIALQIAVGSRPPDLCWDVSGDKRVTLLDALMILRAAWGYRDRLNLCIMADTDHNV